MATLVKYSALLDDNSSIIIRSTQQSFGLANAFVHARTTVRDASDQFQIAASDEYFSDHSTQVCGLPIHAVR